MSLYNETMEAGNPPTPAIGGVGLIADIGEGGARSPSRRRDDDVLLVGGSRAGSAARLALDDLRAAKRARRRPSILPPSAEAANLCGSLIAAGRITAVHDRSDGGLAVALAEMAMASGIGATVEASGPGTASFSARTRAAMS